MNDKNFHWISLVKLSKLRNFPIFSSNPIYKNTPNPPNSTTKMNKSIPIIAILLLQISISYAASDSIYESFLKCLPYNSNPSEISSILYSQSNSSYSSIFEAYVRNLRFDTNTTTKPIIIITATNITHVQATVLCSKAIGIQLKIRSGGHDYEGLSYVSDVTPFVILDMFNLRSITINTDAETAWVQAGATLGELYYAISDKSDVLGFPAGVCSTVGVGGHLSGGGYGHMIRRFGLTIDHVIDAQIVDTNGMLLDREAMGEDLFWAIRGGGAASFGVVISYKINLVSVPKINTFFRLQRTLDQNALELVYKWQDFAPKTDDRLFLRLLLQPVSSQTQKGSLTMRASFIAMWLGNSDDLVSLMTSEFPELNLTKGDCNETSWIGATLYWSNFEATDSPSVLRNRTPESINFLKRKSDYVQTPISRDGLDGIFKKMIELGKVGFVFNPYGGKMNEIEADATPFPHRAGNLFKIQYSVNWQDPGVEAENNYINQTRSLYSYMTPYVSQSPRGAFLNYRDLDIGVNHHDENSYSDGKVYGEKYFMGNFDRLVKVKTAVDPDNFFRNEQSIPVLPAQE